MSEPTAGKPVPSNGDDVVSELQRLLGPSTVFINWPLGVKGGKVKWRHMRASHMTAKYLAEISKGNIGVALGDVSHRLCAIDLDRDELIEPFLALNPRLRDTLQTHGARGRVFWVRFDGEYPARTIKLKTLDGNDAGEFRSNGSQSIVWGIHPNTKKPYRFIVQQPVATIDFESIKWPSEIVNPFQAGSCTEETEGRKTQKNRRTEELKSSASYVPRLFHSTICNVEDAIYVSLPHRKFENNNLLFKLARALKTLEIKGHQFGLHDLKSIFSKWHERAKPFLRVDQSQEDYYLEFMNACARAKYPLGGVKVAQAWEKAKSQPLPVEAMQFENLELRVLVAFFKELQRLNEPEPFFITYRDCGMLLGHKHHTTATTWIGALIKLQYISVAKPGNERQATRYYYVWKPAESNGD